MKIRQIRNATLCLSLGEHRLIVDPMLAAPGSLPAFRLFGKPRRRNPLVPLPPGSEAWLSEATGALITHEHPDHFDRRGLAWVRERGLPVWASPIDAPYLRRKGLDVNLLEDGALGMKVELVPARHGRGLIGWLMGPVAGCFLAHPGEPSIYLTSDATLSEEVLAAVERLRPEVIVAPAGAANFGIGKDILFSVDELMELAHRAPGRLVFNHLEALDHCPTTREELRRRVEEEGLGARVFIPEDGEELSFERSGAAVAGPSSLAPFQQVGGFQKWLTAKFAGT